MGLGVTNPTVSFCLAFGFAFSVTYWMVQNVTTNERINQARYSYFHQYAPPPQTHPPGSLLPTTLLAVAGTGWWSHL